MKNKQLSSCLISLALALGFALVFYTCNTPLGPVIGSDNAMYMTMGTALNSGYAPYTEIFDHKGPLLFLLQWLPQAVSGGYSTLAIFVQEVIFLFACLRVLDAGSKETGTSSVMMQLFYLAFNCSVLDGGNLTEEYAGLFTLCGLLIILRVFGHGLDTRKKLLPSAALLGAAAMLAFLTRANNALVLCAMTLVLAAALLATRRFVQLGACAAGFVLGMAAVLLPVCLWLAANGALEEAFYGSIIHNMMYANTGSTSRVYTLLYTPYGYTAIVMAAFSCAGALAWFRRSPALSAAMTAGAAAAGFAAFISHKFYYHYLMLGSPLAAVGAGMALSAVQHAYARRFNARAPLAAALAVCALWLGTNAAAVTSQRHADLEGLDQFILDAQTLYNMVPEEDRDSFMAYRVEPKWYVATKALPSMRFYFLQEILADADPAVMDEIVDTFASDAPRWLVIYYNRPFSPPYDTRVDEIFQTRYEFVAASGTYQLLRLKEM